MPAPFKNHPSDSQILNENTVPLSQCPRRLVQRGSGWIEVTNVPILTAECLWHIYQKEAEEIVAPGGVLIADPIARNRAINAAYARLWLADPRFQWAGLAAFASKQVGCGMLHATSQTALMYSDCWFRLLLLGNHASFVLEYLSGVSQALELTLSSQCKPLDDGRTIGFSDSLIANLSVLKQRMPFVLRAARQFDEMLKDHRRSQLEQSIAEIAMGAPS